MSIVELRRTSCCEFNACSQHSRPSTIARISIRKKIEIGPSRDTRTVLMSYTLFLLQLAFCRMPYVYCERPNGRSSLETHLAIMNSNLPDSKSHVTPLYARCHGRR